jgi:transposase
MGMRGRGGRDFGVGWATVMAAVREDGARLLRRARPGAQASAIGVDETAFSRATALTATVFTPDVVDLHAGKLIDVLEVETRKVLADWLSINQHSGPSGPKWQRWIPSAATARPCRPGWRAVRMLDPFHVVRARVRLRR